MSKNRVKEIIEQVLSDKGVEDFEELSESIVEILDEEGEFEVNWDQDSNDLKYE